jgi:hypothetical protein
VTSEEAEHGAKLDHAAVAAHPDFAARTIDQDQSPTVSATVAATQAIARAWFHAVQRAR